MKSKILIILLLLISSISTLANGSETIRIGALANRGREECLSKWKPTAAYLGNKIPQYRFKILPLSYKEFGSSVKDQKIDFLISNPGFFVEMESLYGATSIATFKTKIFKGYYSVYGGVIFTKADKDIRTLLDLKGKRFMAVEADSLGGWLCALRELRQAGIDEVKDFASFSYGGSHDAVVRAVLSGSVDAGTCRTGVIEDLVARKKMKLQDLRIIVPDLHEIQQQKDDFPFLLSTRLYPEWTFAKLTKTSPDLAKKVAIALLVMDVNEQAAIAAQSGGWTYPLNYKQVHELMRELRIGHYKNLDQISISQVLRQYRIEIAVTILIFLLILVAFILLTYLYKKMAAAKNAMDKELGDRTKAEQALRKSKERFKNISNQLEAIFDHIPAHIFYKDNNNNFIRVNKYLANTHLKNKVDLEGKSLFELYPREDAQRYYQDDLDVLNNGISKMNIEEKMQTKNGTKWVNTSKIPFFNDAGAIVGIIGISMDITERKQREIYKEMGNEVLQILNEQGDIQESVLRVIAALKKRTGFDAIGIRLQDGDDFPYLAQQGFSDNFLLTENTLIARSADGSICYNKDGKVKLECTCGLVISGKTDPSNPLFTRGGSFWINDSFTLLDLPSDQDTRLNPRNQCMHHGYASMAMVPIPNKDGITGLIHIDDRRKGCFTIEIIEYLEGIASHIGSALMRKRAEEALRESEKKFRELSTIDELTTLYNSRHFYFQLKIELERSNRYQQPLTLLLFDLDNFKSLNDTYGHLEGDHVLRRLGQVIKRCLRETDFAYRYGGEEFTVLLPMTTSVDGISTAERIRTEFKNEIFVPTPGREIHLTLSIGLAQYKPQEEMKDFVRRVDQLMYQAKKAGKDMVSFE